MMLTTANEMLREDREKKIATIHRSNVRLDLELVSDQPMSIEIKCLAMANIMMRLNNQITRHF